MIRTSARVLGLLMAVLLPVLAACGEAAPKSEQAAANPQNTQTPQKTPQPEAAKGRLGEIKKAGKFRVGWAEYNPFEFRDPKENKLVGILIDIPQEWSTKWGVQTEFVEDAWPTLTTSTATGKWDAAFLGITPARAEQVDFTDAVFETDFTVLVKKTAGYKSFDDVDKPGKKFVVTTGSNTDEALTQRVKHAEIVRVKDVANVFLQLSSGKVDGMATQRDYLMQRESEFPEYTVLADNFGRSRMALAIGKNQPDYLADLNAMIKEGKQSGLFQKLIAKHKLVGNQVSP